MWNVICCPNCYGDLRPGDASADCKACGITYPRSERGQFDLRLQRSKNVSLEFTLGIPALSVLDEAAESLERNDSPEIDFDQVDLPAELSSDHLSYIPQAKSPDDVFLDLGCGGAHFRRVASHIGYRYLGVDYYHHAADILGDAQALPFRAGSIACVWTGSMIQYVPFGFPMIREINRVLVPGGKLLGTVAFLEAFDGNSFCMYTHHGINSLLTYGGFAIHKLAPDRWWTAPVAVSAMGLFPQMSPRMARRLANLVEPLSRTWWRLGSWKRGKRYGEIDRLKRTTAMFLFVAEKPSNTESIRNRGTFTRRQHDPC